VVKMPPKDNVLVALTDLAIGENVIFEKEKTLECNPIVPEVVASVRLGSPVARPS